MKKYILAINLLAILLFISSCEDIVDADYKIKKTKINYRTVIADQENGVIMPLKVGNLWIYKITDFNNDGSVRAVSYDSLLIKRDTLINGEKWFIVEEPQYDHNDLLYLTNTDIGLWFTCSECLNKSYLRAEYPLKHTSYYIGALGIRALVDDPPTPMDDSLDIWIEAENLANIFTNVGSFNCYKYSAGAELRKAGSKYNPWFVEYYVPDLGLVKTEQYKSDNNNVMKIETVKELVYTNLLKDILFKQNTYEIDFKHVHLGQSKDTTIIKIIQNDTQNNCVINSIQITPDVNFSIVNSLAFPYVILPNKYFGLMLNFTPVSLGDFESEMLINTNQGNFTVILKGKCIN